MMQEDNNLLFFGDIAKCNDKTDYIEKTKKRYFFANRSRNRKRKYKF